jgi:hypothetical protein
MHAIEEDPQRPGDDYVEDRNTEQCEDRKPEPAKRVKDVASRPGRVAFGDHPLQHAERGQAGEHGHQQQAEAGDQAGPAH